MKKIVLFVCLFFATNTLLSQVFWENKALTFPIGRRVRSISYVDANIVWVNVGFNGPIPAGQPQVQEWARSVDGGNTWVTGSIFIGNVSLGIANIYARSATEAYITAFDAVAGSGPGGGVWRTIDGGLNWVKQSTATYGATTSFANFVHFWDANNGVTMGDPAGGYYEIYTTSNGGTNWNRVASSNIPALTGTTDFGIAGEYAVVGNTIWFSTTTGRLIKSVDRGLTWVAQKTPISSFGIDASFSAKFAFTDANNGIIIGSDWVYHRTSNGGTDWTPLPADGTIRNGNISSVPGLTNAYVINGNDNNAETRGSSYTLDGGLTWTDVNPLGDIFSVLPDSVKFFNTSSGLTGGVGVDAATGGIFKYVGNFFNPLSNSQFSSNNLFQVSPNPTSDKLSLTGSNINQVQVTDILGKVVLNNNYSALSNVELNIADFNAGIYMVKITNNESVSSVVKVVKQ